MDKIGILRCGVIQMLSIKVPYSIKNQRSTIYIELRCKYQENTMLF